RTPYVELSSAGQPVYAEHHRTMSDWVGLLVSAGFTIESVTEPEWPESNHTAWGGWSPLRGALMPGTVIFSTTLREDCRRVGRRGDGSSRSSEAAESNPCAGSLLRHRLDERRCSVRGGVPGASRAAAAVERRVEFERRARLLGHDPCHLVDLSRMDVDDDLVMDLEEHRRMQLIEAGGDLEHGDLHDVRGRSLDRCVERR